MIDGFTLHINFGQCNLKLDYRRNAHQYDLMAASRLRGPQANIGRSVIPRTCHTCSFSAYLVTLAAEGGFRSWNLDLGFTPHSMDVWAALVANPGRTMDAVQLKIRCGVRHVDRFDY